MTALIERLPELVTDLEGALLPLGRGDLVTQLQSATLFAWRYDEFADALYLQLSAEPVDMMKIDRLSLYDELGMNVDCDTEGRVCGVEILAGKPIADRLAGRPSAQ